jgi:Pseudouridylate synthases, 23S RNA-specific
VIEQLRQAKLYKFLELAHRLDKETSGILILAKKRLALVELQEQMKNNQITKEYFALTIGAWRDEKRNVKAPIL